MRSVNVIVPSLEPSGPIRGAVALCNGLVKHLPVTLVPLKSDVVGDGLVIYPRVKILSLAKYRRWRDKYNAYRQAVRRSGGREEVVSISFCFSADTFNFFMARYATIISSIRGNLLQNYRFEYGWFGVVAAFVHFLILHRFSKVITISNAMARQLRRFGIFRLATIGNFVDEENLGYQREFQIRHSSTFHFLFLGRLTPLKCPELLIQSISALRARGINCHLDLVGDGPMRSELEVQVRRLSLDSWVTFHGYLPNPYRVLQRADCMVLPSHTEGISRAVIEALFFGVPIILRNVDANCEVIIPGVNGEVFTYDEQLVEIMVRLVETQVRYARHKPRNLLPDEFRQETNVQRFLELVLQ